MKATCTSFINVMKVINQNGIKTLSELMENEALYNTFWFAVEELVAYALRSKTGKKNEEGEITSGNARKIETLKEYGLTTDDDIHSDCVIKIMNKLDLVLKQHPVEKQKNYCYTICNNVVNDQFRMLPPDDIEVIYLQDAVKSQRVSSEDACAYEEIIGTDTYNGEKVFMEKETVTELSRVLEAKKAKERSERRETIIKEIKRLYKKPEEICVRLACEHLKMNPRDLAPRVAEAGEEVTYAEVLKKVAQKNDIQLADLRNYIADNRIAANALWSETKDVKVIASQISRLVWRAKDKLSK